MQGITAYSPSYNDLAGLNDLRSLSRTNQSAAVSEVAKQFESIFISQMLKSMRGANDAFARSGLFSSWEMNFRQEMFDSQLSLSMAQGKGVGLAAFFERELKKNLPAGEPDSVIGEVTNSRQALRRYLGVPNVVLRQRASNIVAKPIERIDTEFNDAEGFLSRLAPAAERAAKRLGVDPSVLLAQAALETGWGKAVIQTEQGSSYNLFNIKAGADWEGKTQRVATVEYDKGLVSREWHNFRVYESYEASFADYAEFLFQSPRYQPALEHAGEPERFVRALQEAGYATDPVYAEKILAILECPEMTRRSS